jgi:hypothetical protein
MGRGRHSYIKGGLPLVPAARRINYPLTVKRFSVRLEE